MATSNLIHIPREFKCQFSQKIILHPTVAADNYIYEHKMIVQFINELIYSNSALKSPTTGEDMNCDLLEAPQAILDELEAFLLENPELERTEDYDVKDWQIFDPQRERIRSINIVPITFILVVEDKNDVDYDPVYIRTIEYMDFEHLEASQLGSRLDSDAEIKLQNKIASIADALSKNAEDADALNRCLALYKSKKKYTENEIKVALEKALKIVIISKEDEDDVMISVKHLAVLKPKADRKEAAILASSRGYKNVASYLGDWKLKKKNSLKNFRSSFQNLLSLK